MTDLQPKKMEAKKIHRWQPNGYTPCGRRLKPGLRVNIGYWLSEGVTCKVCLGATSFISIVGDYWNGECDGYSRAKDGEEIEIDMNLEASWSGRPKQKKLQGVSLVEKQNVKGKVY